MHPHVGLKQQAIGDGCIFDTPRLERTAILQEGTRGKATVYELGHNSYSQGGINCPYSLRVIPVESTFYPGVIQTEIMYVSPICGKF
ncbi:MAG: hypothetical protein VKL59_20145 [Nostocaceae cyanobacterium]|nr:hypothetical protein [Nostocaceae cyanobacterium]